MHPDLQLPQGGGQSPASQPVVLIHVALLGGVTGKPLKLTVAQRLSRVVLEARFHSGLNEGCAAHARPERVAFNLFQKGTSLKSL